MTSFTVTLTPNDWDKVLGGWRCPVLRIPGAEAERLYAGGAQLDPSWYRIEAREQIVRWARESAPPESAALAVSLTKELAPAEKRDFWKTLALFAPVLAAAVTAAGAYLVAGTKPAQANPPPTLAGEGYERWTVTGRVQVEDASPHAVTAMVQPPIIPLLETGTFNADIPVFTRANGDVALPTLTFFPRQPGYKPTSVELGDPRAERVGQTTNPPTASAAASGAAPGYATLDHQLKVDHKRRRIEVGRVVRVERERTAYDPVAAGLEQPAFANN